MKSRTVYVLALTLLFTVCSTETHAQFWKKLFGKEEKYERKKPAKPKSKNIFPEQEPEVEKKRPKKKHHVDYPESRIKTRYRIDVLIPLFLDELVKDGKPSFKGKIPDKAGFGLDFYEGLKLAADTLNEFSYNLDIYVHDITNPESGIGALTRKKTLDSSDLIIGAFSSQYIPEVARFAKERQINFVSALSPSDGDVKDNPYFILLQPKFEVHCEQLIEIISKKFRKAEPIIVYRTSSNNDDIAFSYFSDLDASAKIECNNPENLERLRDVMDSTANNIILMPILDASYAEKLLAGINERFPQYSIEIFGMPSWDGMPLLKKNGSLGSLGVHFTSPFYFDISTTSGKAVADRYKRVTGNAYPSEFVYRGYETIYWYIYLLTRYGTIFNEKLGDNGTAPFTRFDIKPVWNEKDEFLYYENRHLYLYRYQDGSFMVESE